MAAIGYPEFALSGADASRAITLYAPRQSARGASAAAATVQRAVSRAGA